MATAETRETTLPPGGEKLITGQVWAVNGGL
jgi:hypothetical protein